MKKKPKVLTFDLNFFFGTSDWESVFESFRFFFDDELEGLMKDGAGAKIKALSLSVIPKISVASETAISHFALCVEFIEKADLNFESNFLLLKYFDIINSRPCLSNSSGPVNGKIFISETQL